MIIRRTSTLNRFTRRRSEGPMAPTTDPAVLSVQGETFKKHLTHHARGCQCDVERLERFFALLCERYDTSSWVVALDRHAQAIEEAAGA